MNTLAKISYGKQGVFIMLDKLILQLLFLFLLSQGEQMIFAKDPLVDRLWQQRGQKVVKSILDKPQSSLFLDSKKKIVTSDHYNELIKTFDQLEDELLQLASFLEEASYLMGINKGPQLAKINSHLKDFLQEGFGNEFIFSPPILSSVLMLPISSSDLNMADEELIEASKPLRATLLKILYGLNHNENQYFAKDFKEDLEALHDQYEDILPLMVKHFQKLGNVLRAVYENIESSVDETQEIFKGLFEALSRKVY